MCEGPACQQAVQVYGFSPGDQRRGGCFDVCAGPGDYGCRDERPKPGIVGEGRATMAGEVPQTTPEHQAPPGGRATGGDGREGGREPGPRRRRRVLLVLAILILVGAVVGVWYWLATRGWESTDDAFIESAVVQVAPRVAGSLVVVAVDDNQLVRAGDLLARLDPRDFQTRADQAQAALSLAEAMLESARVSVRMTEASTAAAVDEANAALTAAQAKVEQQRAEVVAAQTELDRAQAERERYEALPPAAASQQQRDVVRAAAESAAARLRANQTQVAAAEAEVEAARSRVVAAEADRLRVDVARAEVTRREAEVRQAGAALEEARLMLSYTEVTAPVAGRVTRKAAWAGDYVQIGEALLALVPVEAWVVANFKETQLGAMRAGQGARIRIDAYGASFDGHVDSVQAGSGVRFSLLPPENATGNYVKVVQRVPVKIVFDPLPDPGRYLLGPGMSVVARVRVK
jgi:membrane fusion protein (multidrug efflux system)